MAIKNLEEFMEFYEKDTRITEIGLYGISGMLLAYAYYRKRPITKFSHPSQIPKFFIKEKMIQPGTVSKIEPTLLGPLLHVNHKPPVNLFFFSKKTLPVKISGIEINANGFSWLQTVTANKKIDFLPLSTAGNAAECQVFLLEKNKKPLDIGKALLSLGFARSAPLVKEITAQYDIKSAEKYYQQLQKIETTSKSRRLGMWSTLPSPWPLRMFGKQWDSLKYTMTPDSRKLPELVR
ncbi:unnamed protein product [Diamesa hyperborea]